jgi:hypothetical protein
MQVVKLFYSNCLDKGKSAVGFFYDLFSSKFHLKNYRSNALYALLGTVLFCKVTDLSILYKIFIRSIVPNGFNMVSSRPPKISV